MEVNSLLNDKLRSLSFSDNSKNKQLIKKKQIMKKIKNWLQRLSFRTGVIVLLCCIPFYILSFAQMALPVSNETKGVMWVILFGLAKTFQYSGLTILGTDRIKRLKARWQPCKRRASK